ncbi:hypothetical protein [Paenibacillus ottowii]
MICPVCNNTFSLNDDFNDEMCSHCTFYFYLQHILRISFIANLKVEQNEALYFSNVHRNIYDPFIEGFNGSAKDGAEEIIKIYVDQFKDVISGYAKEDLLFMAFGLRELSAWSVFDSNVWESTRIREISHILTNLIEMTEDYVFGDKGIVDETDFISVLVICEELSGVSNNINLVEYFSWKVNLEEMLKTRVENTRLEWFHNYYEVKELAKPEEIEFQSSPLIQKYIDKRNLNIGNIKREVGKEINKLLGFSFEDVSLFRDSIINIASCNGQLFEHTSKVNNKAMTSYFIFEEQLKEIDLEENTILKILGFFTYKGMKARSNKYKKFSNPHMDYKFIFRFDNIISLGELDSSNSITIFENISVTDHFVSEFYGHDATRPFKKSQEKISTLMAYKISSHFMENDNYFVPLLEKGVPHVNVKNINGNGVKRNIVSNDNKDLGDLDAIVVDKNQKKLIIFEIKYYKPAVELTEVLSKDKKIYDDIKKIQNRAIWVENNLSNLIKAWNLEESSYNVETILVTARPNFFGKELEETYTNIRYETYDSILKM